MLTLIKSSAQLKKWDLWLKEKIKSKHNQFWNIPSLHYQLEFFIERVPPPLYEKKNLVDQTKIEYMSLNPKGDGYNSESMGTHAN